MFSYCNVNPENERTNDCVCRAISLATDNDYYYIQYLLHNNAYSNRCDMLTKVCYRNLLEDLFELEPRYGNGRTVVEVARRYPDNKVIMRIDSHLTCSCYGVVKDIWDCSHELVDEYWVV